MSDISHTNSVLAIIPAYNEGRHIGDVVRQTLSHLPVLVIDDGSTDQTAAEAELAGAEVVRQIPNQGKGVALMRGFREAINKGYSAVVMLDADGQHDPDEIPAFLEAYRAGGDLVIGKRDFRYMPQPRRTTNRIGTWMFSWAVGQHIPDNQSGYRLLSSRMMEATLDSKETNFEFEVEMIVVCIQRGYQLAWVPIRTIYGDERSHIRPLRHIYHFSRVVLQARQAIRRARKHNQ
ncbi:MAG: glycosyltransferase family 2 protein [Chloroflexi bacterium]|mgnify:FL=1|nr:glycosyltransferase family 2 protein [Chloroflexota bacterium]